jgi:hypothetical protein
LGRGLRPVGEGVVHRQLAGLGAALPHDGRELLLGGLGDVLVEPPRRRAGREDALDRVVLEGAVLQRVVHRRKDIVGLVALAKR